MASDDHQADVRVGSKTEVAPLKWEVRSTLRSGHRQAVAARPFRANNGSARAFTSSASAS
jgi:hypothetical protein